MPRRFHDLRMEFRPMLRLAAPLALGELGWMAMGVADTIMAGPLGPAAIGAGSLGSMLFYPIAIAGMGLLFGMDTLVAQSHGAGERLDSRRTLVNGFWMATALAGPLTLALWAMLPLVERAGTNPRVFEQFRGYLGALLWSILPLLYYTALRRYLQAVDIVKPITFALVSANIVNLAANYALMYGHWGFPALGLTGSGYATTLSRSYMAAALLATVVWHERRTGALMRRVRWLPEAARIRRLADLGIPSALQILAEGGVFGIVTVLASRLDEASLAAHGLAINVISTTFMVPLGISSAAAVRVGQAIGRKDPAGAAAAGWSALLMRVVFMGGAAVALWSVPRGIIAVYTRDAAVLATGAALLRIAAFFQLFDGLQVVATGALRGLGDTRTPMLIHLAGYWGAGLPVAYLLCFSAGWGAAGIWVGLSSALIMIGLTLVRVWRRRARKLA